MSIELRWLEWTVLDRITCSGDREFDTLQFDEDKSMATVIARTSPTTNGQRLREEWLERMSILMESVEKWAEELGWATRRIEKEIDDSEIGRHRVPALLLQQETTRMLLDPIARSAPAPKEWSICT